MMMGSLRYAHASRYSSPSEPGSDRTTHCQSRFHWQGDRSTPSLGQKGEATIDPMSLIPEPSELAGLVRIGQGLAT